MKKLVIKSTGSKPTLDFIKNFKRDPSVKKMSKRDFLRGLKVSIEINNEFKEETTDRKVLKSLEESTKKLETLLNAVKKATDEEVESRIEDLILTKELYENQADGLVAMKTSESKPSQMSPQELEKVFNSLKSKGQVDVWAESVMSSGSPKWVTYDVGRKSKSKKYDLEKITLTRGGGGYKSFLYNRAKKGGVSFALGDMGASLIALRKV